MVYRPRTPEEMEQINALVRSSVGYDANRGDVVEVENMRFVNMMPEIEEVQEILIWAFTKDELIRIAEGNWRSRCRYFGDFAGYSSAD